MTPPIWFRMDLLLSFRYIDLSAYLTFPLECLITISNLTYLNSRSWFSLLNLPLPLQFPHFQVDGNSIYPVAQVKTFEFKGILDSLFLENILQ